MISDQMGHLNKDDLKSHISKAEKRGAGRQGATCGTARALARCLVIPSPSGGPACVPAGRKWSGAAAARPLPAPRPACGCHQLLPPSPTRVTARSHRGHAARTPCPRASHFDSPLRHNPHLGAHKRKPSGTGSNTLGPAPRRQACRCLRDAGKEQPQETPPGRR